MGLGDVESLARCINDAVLRGGDVGSYTALVPYAQDRYFKNHKLMSAVDKLHKLYASTSEPLVWARSVGLEVLNELDSVKGAIMMSAGASHRVKHGLGWSLAVRGIEGVSNSIGAANMASGALAGIVGAGLHGLWKANTLPK
jgi:ubiquinone biosynthesis monooxygenase Coq6